MSTAGLLHKLEELGLEATASEVQEGMLILQLSAKDQQRLLADTPLRESVARQVKEAGFARVVLDLNGGGGWI